jgi:hypothetical protein
VQEVLEGGDDNEDSHLENKVATTLTKIMPKRKKQPTQEDTHMGLSSNVGTIEVSPLEGNK